MALAKKSIPSYDPNNAKSILNCCFFEDESEMKKIVELVFKNMKEVN